MKKIFSLVLSVILILSIFSLAGCGKKDDTPDVAETLKFGLGSYSYVEKVASADGDTNGNGNYVTTVAAVLLDKDGKFVNAAIDTADNTVEFTSAGKAVTAGEFKTKYEKGDDYGMVAYGGSKKEWYSQVDSFVNTIKGKTIDEVKALVANGGKGTDEVINAGCTIAVADFVLALEKAVANASDLEAAKNTSLKLGVVSTQSTVKDATEEAEGANEVSTTFSAAAKDKDGKVIAMRTDALSIKFTFDAKGVTALDNTMKITTKREDGDSYGMVAYGGAKKEWYEQADEFDKACKGKTADEISALAAADGKAGDTLVTAGCTINVADMVKSAIKAAK